LFGEDAPEEEEAPVPVKSGAATAEEFGEPTEDFNF